MSKFRKEFAEFLIVFYNYKISIQKLMRAITGYKMITKEPVYNIQKQLQPRKNVRFENANIYISNDITLAMGNYFFADYNDEVKVEYSFGYHCNNDEFKIVLHHSSLPYSS